MCPLLRCVFSNSSIRGLTGPTPRQLDLQLNLSCNIEQNQLGFDVVVLCATNGTNLVNFQQSGPCLTPSVANHSQKLAKHHRHTYAAMLG